MSPQTLTLIINAVIGALIFLGFLWGVGRGLFKSTIRLVFVLAICAAMLFLAPSISNWIVNFDFSTLFSLSISGQPFTTVQSLIMNLLNSNTQVADFLAANPTILSFVEQLPLVLMNVIVFILGVFVFKVLTYPIYAIIAHFAIPKQKKGEKEFYKAKKYRLFGGVVGAVQGLVLAMVLLMPLSAFTDVLISIDELPSYAEASEVHTAGEGGSFLRDVLGLDEEIISYLYSYDNSFFQSTIKAVGLNKVSDAVFNELASVQVNGVKVKLLDEVDVVTTTYKQVNNILVENDLTNVQDMNETDIIRVIATMNYDDIEELINTVFSSNTVDLLGEQLISYVATVARDEYPGLTEQDIAEINELITEALDELSATDLSVLKSDIISVVRFIKVLQTNNLFAFATSTEPDYLTALQLAIDTDDQVATEAALNDILDYVLTTVDGYSEAVVREMVAAIFNSQTLRNLLPYIANAGIGTLNSELGTTIATIEPTTIDWESEITDFASILYNVKELGFEAYDVYVAYSESATEPSIADIRDIVANDIHLSALGTILNTFRGTQLLGGMYQGIFEQILLSPEYGLSALPAAVSADFALQFVNFMNIDWAVETSALQNTAIEALDFYVVNQTMFESNDFDVDMLSVADLTDLVNAAFNSTLVKELLYQAANYGAYEINASPDTFFTDDAQIVAFKNMLLAKLDNLDVEEIRLDLIALIDVLETLQASDLLAINSENIVSTLDGLSEAVVNEILTELFSAETINESLPYALNIAISQVNSALTTDVQLVNLETYVQLDATEIAKLANMVYSLKEFGIVIANSMEVTGGDPDFTNEAVLASFEQLGIALNDVKSLTVLDGVYEDLINKVLFNTQILAKINVPSTISLTAISAEILNTTDWTNEMEAITTIIRIGSSLPVTAQTVIDTLVSSPVVLGVLDEATTDNGLAFITVNQTLKDEITVIIAGGTYDSATVAKIYNVLGIVVD